MNKTRWNCYHDPTCQKGAADCWKCDMFRQKLEPAEQASMPRSAALGYTEPDPDLPMTEVAWLEQRLDQLEGRSQYLQSRYQDLIKPKAGTKPMSGPTQRRGIEV